jgi:hypothetical protein
MSKPDHIATERNESTPAPAKRQRSRKAAPEPEQPTAAYIDVAPREYDTDLIRDFLDMVFHAVEPEDKGEILTWAVPKHRKPIYPGTEDELYALLDGTRSGQALYYGTATCRRDNAGKLFNRQALFERLHVIVLDDIGTKGDVADLPENLKPTYIIESSKGNYQYGYVLETPIDNLDAAKALVKIMYEAGIADAGGKMPNKLVRLPEGINGKEGEKCHFVTKLVDMAGPLWSPQGLLDALDCGATWAEIATDSLEATKRRGRLKAGSTPWAPYRPTMESMSGIIDPVAEWLVENDQIVQDQGEWLTVKCPWADQHTSGDTVAGYKPLGRGEDPDKRGFHCFHDSCNTVRTTEYLQFVANLGGPSAGVKSEAAGMIATYVYDAINDCAWKIKDTVEPKQLTMAGLRNTHPRKTLVAGINSKGEPKLTPVAEYQQWLTSESRVTVMGPTFAPDNPSRLVEREGDLYVNQFSPPSWGSGTYSPEHVERFTQFLEYLIPDKDEREYFTNWIAAKCQNMGFRGAAIVMVAQAQGVGRSTLGDMIATMLGSVNVRTEKFDKMTGDQQYNDWLEAPFVISNETLNTGGLNCYKTYEALKAMIDPRPTLETINPKYGKQRRSMVHSSFLFLSNHSNALAMAEGDRRFYVISNPHLPAAPEFFTKLNTWLGGMGDDGRPEWARHVYRWLLDRKIDVEVLLAPPAMTAGKAAMMEESRSEIDLAAREVFAKWPCEYISATQFTRAIEHFADRLDLYDISSYKAQIKRIFANATYPLAQQAVLRLDGKTTRFRVLINKATAETAEKGKDLDDHDRRYIRSALVPANIAESLKKVADALDVAGL